MSSAAWKMDTRLDRAAARVTKLRELAPSLSRMVVSHGPATTWDTENGPPAIGFEVPLAHNDGVLCIAEILVPAGAVFPRHIHDAETEYAFILSGEIRVELDNGDVTVVGRGGFITVPPGTAHRSEALMDTWCLAIGIPPIEGFPGVANSQ